MNTAEMMRILDSIARDRNVDKSLLISDLETAMVSACRKFFGTLDAEEFQCTVDPLTGEIQLFRYDEPLEMNPGDFGRIAAQTFKQVMIQRRTRCPGRSSGNRDASQRADPWRAVRSR